MSFVRIKIINGYAFRYLVESRYNKETKKISQKVIKYLGKAQTEGGLLDEWKRRDVLDLDGNKCVQCGSKEDLVIDHIIPMTVKVDNRLENLQCLCRKCNVKKRQIN